MKQKPPALFSLAQAWWPGGLINANPFFHSFLAIFWQRIRVASQAVRAALRVFLL